MLGLCGTAATAAAQWPSNYAIRRIGLTGPEHTGSGGLQYSYAQAFNAPTSVAGYSYRYLGVSTNNGLDAWVWNAGAGGGGVITRIGLAGEGYTGSAGYRSSRPILQSPSGHVAGSSGRIVEVSTNNGEDAWVWDGVTTIPIGLAGPSNIGSAGFRRSRPELQNAAGQVAGFSMRITGVSTDNGRDTWVWDGVATHQVGLTGGANTGTMGFQQSYIQLQNSAGHVVGSSLRFADVSTNLGEDAWAWDGTTTTQIGLFGAAHTGSTGFRRSVGFVQNASGLVAGYSARIVGAGTDNGVDAWVWDGTTTTQVGLTGPGYVGNAGYQSSSPRYLSDTGQLAGTSRRYTDSGTLNGVHAWVRNGSTTILIGLTGGIYTGSAGYEVSDMRARNSAGHIAGISQRAMGVSGANGQDSWVWNGVVTTPIGLTGGVYIGSAGYQNSSPVYLNASGQVAGHSQRISGERMDNGADSWVWDGATTIQVGLSGGVYTGSAGYQVSYPAFQNAAGAVAGYTLRIANIDTQIGGLAQDAWYFDPVTRMTTAIVGSVRASDNYALSRITTLTEDGFLIGYYQYFENGIDPGVNRAFVFHPDRGFTDLGELVNGGLTAAGWSTLQRPQFSDALRTIVGFGLINGQSGGLSGGQSVFVMTLGTPCDADIDSSGSVDADDIFAFLDSWFLQNGQSGPGLSADFDGSGAVDADDIFVFLDAWFAQSGVCDD